MEGKKDGKKTTDIKKKGKLPIDERQTRTDGKKG